MKVLVTGASGQIGRTLVHQLKKVLPEKADTLFLLSHEKSLPNFSADIANEIVMSDKITDRFDVAIHLAAIISTPFCQKPENRDLVIATNIGLTETVCEYSDFVVMLSTDNVFKGDKQQEYRETEEPNPCNFYGASKLQAEKVVIAGRGAVVRAQTMLGCKNLITTAVVDTIRGKPHPPFWNDTFSRPAFLPDLINVLGAILGNRMSGIFHCSTTGEVFSRAQIAKIVLQFFRDHNLPRAIKIIPEEPCSVSSFPRHLVLNTEMTRNRLELNFHSSREAMNEHLKYFLTDKILCCTFG